jgi:hypothetical protein
VSTNVVLWMFSVKFYLKDCFVLIRVINLWLIYQLSSCQVFLSVMVM